MLGRHRAPKLGKYERAGALSTNELTRGTRRSAEKSRIVHNLARLDAASYNDRVRGSTSAKFDCACTTTPFIEVTIDSGQQRVTRQLAFLMRLSTPSATSESSSLKPWKVRMAMCICRLCRSGRVWR